MKYGDPKFNFDRISKLWSVYLKKEIGPRDVTLLMILAKIARDMHKADADNIDDIIGYIVAFDRATNPLDYYEVEPGPYPMTPEELARATTEQMKQDRWWKRLNFDETDFEVRR